MKKKITTLLGLTAAVLTVNAFQGFNDLEFIVGSGTKQAALVIDFHDGASTESYAWGYRWDGAVSGAQMLLDIAAADPLLQVNSGGSVASGFFLNGISYGGQSETNAFGLTGPESVGWGYYAAGGTAGDPPANDIAGGGAALPASWTNSPTGAGEEYTFMGVTNAGRFLEDGSWDAWSFGTYDEFFNHLVPPGASVTAAPVPEPSAFGLVAGCLALLVSLRRFVKR